MLKMVTYEINTLRNSIDAISKIVDEITMTINCYGLEVNAMGRSKISAVHYFLDEDFFEFYDVDEEVHLHIDSEELVTVLKRGGRDDILEIGVDANHIILTFDGKTKKTYRIKLIDLEYKATRIPEADLCHVELPSDLLKEAVDDIKTFSEKVQITLNEDIVVFESPGSFIDASVEYLHTSSVEGVCVSTYSLEPLKDMLRAYKVSDTAVLGLGTDTFLELTFYIGVDEGELRFTLAPIVADED